MLLLLRRCRAGARDAYACDGSQAHREMSMAVEKQLRLESYHITSGETVCAMDRVRGGGTRRSSKLAKPPADETETARGTQPPRALARARIPSTRSRASRKSSDRSAA